MHDSMVESVSSSALSTSCSPSPYHPSFVPPFPKPLLTVCILLGTQLYLMFEPDLHTPLRLALSLFYTPKHAHTLRSHCPREACATFNWLPLLSFTVKKLAVIRLAAGNVVKLKSNHISFT